VSAERGSAVGVLSRVPTELERCSVVDGYLLAVGVQDDLSDACIVRRVNRDWHQVGDRCIGRWCLEGDSGRLLVEWRGRAAEGL